MSEGTDEFEAPAEKEPTLDDLPIADPFTEAQPAIEDPWHSRPLDVHRWSDHPEIQGMVNELWEKYFADFRDAGDSRPGPKPKTAFKNQLRVLVLDLYVAWMTDPELCIGVAMSVNFWDTTSRYNALHISKQIIPIIHRLVEAQVIELAKGSYSGPWGRGNRTTRIRASEGLQDMFAAVRVSRNDIGRATDEECIILKASDGEGVALVDYTDTPETNRMRDELKAYNVVLAGAFIDIPGLEQAVIERPVLSGKDTGRATTVLLDHHHHFVRRIFSRGSWDANGRFYGPWWQQVGSDVRCQIYINDTPTVEVDFKGLHVAILSAELGVEIEGDPYELAAGLIPGAPPELQRTIVKQLVLTALNARDHKSAYQSFRDGWPANHIGKTITNEELSRLLSAFVKQHPHLADRVCADQGIRLMHVDGQIAERVHRHFTAIGVPVLSVHDSFIIDYTRVAELKMVMEEAAAAVVGRGLKVSSGGLGLDEVLSDDPDPDVVQDFVAWTQVPRCEGYLARLADWEAFTGLEVVPYS